eukprot:TRINITY_DN435_c0_g1_i1.p1 TRINITY_DN435_c0_g1~~TRINITY_DN435_c0_g1_i1.p1  ORF type:complete len:70 (+),score=20.72 TRINITY_DN435_c0_g1_i1:142-351(+)
MTKSFVALFEEPTKPENPLDFVIKFLDPAAMTGQEAEALKKELEELKAQNSQLQASLSAQNQEPEAPSS